MGTLNSLNVNRLVDFFRTPPLPFHARHTYHFHLLFALLMAATDGILANAFLMALKELAAIDWHLTIPRVISGVGMIATLWIGSWIACRPKMPFVQYMGMILTVCCFAMAVSTTAFTFLGLLGIGQTCMYMRLPALGAIIRLNYPATHRGLVTGEIRKWCSIVFLASTLGTAVILNWAGNNSHLLIRAFVLLAGMLSLFSLLVIKRIHVRESTASQEARALVQSPALKKILLEPYTHAVQVLLNDHRFRHYLAGFCFFIFSSLLCMSFVPAILMHELHFSYLGAAILLDVIPSVVSFLSTRSIGKWLDNHNPIRGWIFIRTGWGLDLFLLSMVSVVSTTSLQIALVICIIARVSRGFVMGGCVILWTEIAENYFAPLTATTQYMGIKTFFWGMIRITAPTAGALLLSVSSRTTVFLVGGVGVLLSALHAWIQDRYLESKNRFVTFAEFEAEIAQKTV